MCDPSPQYYKKAVLRITYLFSPSFFSQGMERMYRGCHLIHADLSEYNMMWFEGRVYFIDVSQSVEPSHPHGLEFLVRDCRNVSTFFTKSGVSGVMNGYELFNHLTGLDITADNHEEFLVKVR